MQKKSKRESLGVSMAKMILTVAAIVCAGVFLGSIYSTMRISLNAKDAELAKIIEVKNENQTLEKIKIVTTIPPLYALISNITGEDVKIENLVPPGVNIDDFRPSQADIEKINKADILVANGLGYEVFLAEMLKKVNNKNLKIIEVGDALERLGSVLRPEEGSKNFIVQGGRYVNNSLGISFTDIGRFPGYLKYIPDKPETHRPTRSEYTFWYRGLFINVINKDELRKNGYNFFPPGYAPVKSVVFDCKNSFAPGALMKKCETNQNDFLTQFELVNIPEFYFMGDEDSPTFPKTWQKLYIKSVGDKYVIAYGNLQSGILENKSDKAKTEVGLDKLISQNNLRINDWDKIIDSIEVASEVGDQNTNKKSEANSVNPYIWLSLSDAPYMMQPVLSAVLDLECEKRGGKADLLTVNREIGRGGTVSDDICNFTSKKFTKNISEVVDRSIVEGEGYDNYFPKIWNEENQRGDFYYYTESQFHKNYANFVSMRSQLDEDIAKAVTRMKGKNLIAATNAFQYFLSEFISPEYNRGVISDLKNNQKVNAEELEQLIDFIKINKIEILLKEKGYSDNTVVDTLKNRTGINVVEIDPLYFELKPEGYKNAFNDILGIINGELTLTTLKNAEYTFGLDKEVYKFTDGSFFERYPESAAGSGKYVGIFDNKVAFEDLDKDGKKDAVLVLDSLGGGSGHFYELVVVLNKNGKPVETASLGLGDRVIINSVEIKNGKILIDKVVQDGPVESGCCPQTRKIFEYEFKNNKLTRTSVNEYNEIVATDISTWTTYKDEKYGFEMKYPAGFSRFDTGEEGIMRWLKSGDTDHYGLEIYVEDKNINAKNKTINDVLAEKEKREGAKMKIKETFIGLDKGIIIKTPYPSEENNNTMIMFLHGEYLYNVGFVSSVSDLEKIISTFRFTESSNNIFKFDKIKAGDKVAGMTVKSIESYPGKIYFSGKTTVSGTYNYYGDDQAFFGNTVCFRDLDEQSLAKIPKEANDKRIVWFCFSNQDTAKKMFGPKGGMGKASIEMDDYVADMSEGEAWNRAKLINIVNKNK